MMVEEMISKRIIEERKKQGLSQNKLAEKANVSCSYLLGVETGMERLTVNAFFQLSKALGISPKDLLL